jgi:hypothetical protein
VKNSEAAGGDWWRCSGCSNGIERSVVPIGHDIGIGWDADARHKIYNADKGDEECNPKQSIHWRFLLKMRVPRVYRLARFRVKLYFRASVSRQEEARHSVLSPVTSNGG